MSNPFSDFADWLKSDVGKEKPAASGEKALEAEVSAVPEGAPEAPRPASTPSVSGGPRSVLAHDLGRPVIVPKKNIQNATAAPDESYAARAPAGMRLARFRVDADAEYTFASGGAFLSSIFATMSLVVDGVNAFYGTGYANSDWITRGAILAQAAAAHRGNPPGSSTYGGAMFYDVAFVTATPVAGFWEFTLPVQSKTGLYTVNIQFTSATGVIGAATTGSANVGVQFIFMSTTQTADIPFTLGIKATNNASTLNATGCVGYGLAAINNDLGTTGGATGIVTSYAFGSIGYSPTQIALREDSTAAFLGTPGVLVVAYHGAPLPEDPITSTVFFAIFDTQPTPQSVSVSLGGQYAVIQIAYGQKDAASLLNIQTQG